MNKIFIESLPRRKEGIDWKKSVGYSVRFIYDKNKKYIEGFIEITNYYRENNRGFIEIKYKNRNQTISTTQFLNCSFGKILNVCTDEFKINIGDVFKDGKRDLLIVDKEYRESDRGQKLKFYKYKCNKCGWDEGWMIESSIITEKRNCACCENQVVVEGINDIATTAPWLINLGVSEEDAKKHTKGSNKKIDVVCPICKRVKKIVICNLNNRKSIGCSCGDGFSYNEKFVVEFLNCLNVDYIWQLSKSTFDWIGNYRYDFYLPDYNIIIETHGRQHYENHGFYCVGGKTLNEERENDLKKKELALKNDIDKYIVIDCRKSDLNWIKNNLLKSELSNIFDLSKVDWILCGKKASSNLLFEICNFWNGNKCNNITTKDIAIEFGINRSTVTNYLKKGEKYYDLCDYNCLNEMQKNSFTNGKRNGKKIEVLKDGLSLGKFESCIEVERQSERLFGVKLLNSKISSVALGKKTSYKGYVFRYL